MKDEIKEIIKLNCNEEIEVKYFAKDDSIVDTTMDYGELLDYITNLEQELYKYKKLGFKHLCKKNEKLEQENERLKLNINNAKEFIEQHRVREMSIVEVNALEGILNE